MKVVHTDADRLYAGWTERPDDYVLQPGESLTMPEPWELPFRQQLQDDGTWRKIEDYRGATIWDTTTRESRAVRELGPIPPTHTLLEPVGEYLVWGGRAWVTDEAARAAAAAAAQNARTKARLAEIDLSSIRAIREYIAARADAPVEIIEVEAAAVAVRGDLVTIETAEAVEAEQ